jgi:ribonuclease P protein component
MRPFSFPKVRRVLKHEDFIRKAPGTKKIYFQHFLVVLKPNDLGITRLGLTVGKDRGGAIERNRIKRILREFFRTSKDKLPSSQDIIIVARKGSEPLTYHQIVEELSPLLS